MCTGGKYKYGIFKYSYARMEKAITENSSTGEQGWKMQVRKNRVRNNNAVTGNVSNAVSDLEALASVSNETNKPLLRRLLQYIQKSWLLKSTIGPQCLSVNGSLQQTNNGVVSFHASFRRLVKVAHPGFYAFVEYLQEVTLSNMADVHRLNTSRRIRRPKKKANVVNDKRIRDSIAQYSSIIRRLLCCTVFVVCLSLL